MAFVDDDEIEEVGRIIAEIGRRLAVLRRPAHEGLKDGEEEAAVLRHAALFADVLRLDPHQRIFGKGRERVIGLIGENVAVGQEQDARPARRFAAQIPAAVEQLPRDLKRDERLAGAGGQRQQDALLPAGNRFEHALDGDVLIVAPLEIAALILERHGGKAVAPRIRLGEGAAPQFVRASDKAAPRLPRPSACRCRKCLARWWNR